MDWSSFWGAFIGTTAGILLLTAILFLWFWLDERKNKKNELQDNPAPKPALTDILERHLEEHIVENFTTIFPNWHIFNDLVEGVVTSSSSGRPVGIRLYAKGAGEIDLLCRDDAGNFVVIELKRNKAPDTVITQTDRYISWVEENLAQPGQTVRGIIIAKAYDQRLILSMRQRNNINLWLYNWNLDLQVISPA